MPYDIAEHKHRYNAWAASRASSTKTCRFKVWQGAEILSDSGMIEIGSGPAGLPHPDRIDEHHARWRENVIAQAERHGLDNFGHGVAAKLVNVYLKGMLVCGGHHADPRVGALHPPIDRVLLEALCRTSPKNRRAFWKALRDTGWSKFTSDEYESAVCGIREELGDRPLWEAERHWQGFQGVRAAKKAA